MFRTIIISNFSFLDFAKSNYQKLICIAFFVNGISGISQHISQYHAFNII